MGSIDTRSFVLRMKISALVAFAGVSAQAPSGRIYFEEDLPCDNFADLFPPSDFPDMKTKCKTKRNIKKNKIKTRCNLLCLNGQENVWSTKPIKCKVQRNAGDPDFPVGSYKWNPKSIDGTDLCGIKERCQDPKRMYNLTNKLLNMEKFVDGRRTFYNFSCDDMVSENKVFEMMPFPTDHVTCTCNFNKPNNVRCKWSKVKNSIIRCVRRDREDKFFEGDSGFAYDDMYESY